MNVTPCYKCDSRHVGCHSKCGKYIEWSAKNEKMREKIHKEKEADAMYLEHIRKTKNKTR